MKNLRFSAGDASQSVRGDAGRSDVGMPVVADERRSAVRGRRDIVVGTEMFRATGTGKIVRGVLLAQARLGATSGGPRSDVRSR